MSDERQFRFGYLTEIEEKYLVEGYPSLYSTKSIIDDPEWVLYLEENPDFRLGAYSIDDYHTDLLMEILVVRAGLCLESEAKLYCESKDFTLVVEDQLCPVNTKYKYSLLN